MVAVKQKSAPVGIKAHSIWGSFEVMPQVFAVPEGNDDRLILGSITLGMPGIYPKCRVGPDSKRTARMIIRHVRVLCEPEDQRHFLRDGSRGGAIYGTAT